MPDYHLRSNKAVDRLLWLSALEQLYYADWFGRRFSYYSLAGPTLEDCRLLSTKIPSAAVVSIESKASVRKRQKFHLPSKRTILVENQVGKFLADWQVPKSPVAFWLDYTGLNRQQFDDFRQLINIVPTRSLIRITVNADNKNHTAGTLAALKEELADLWPSDVQLGDSNLSINDYTSVVARAARKSAEAGVSGSMNEFRPISCTVYSDATRMLSLTGCILSSTDRVAFKKATKRLGFADTWEVEEIDVPMLSVKERLRLEPHLPSRSIKRLKKALGHELGSSKETQKALEQYARFAYLIPNFVRVSI